MKWPVELGQFEIHYEPRNAIKAQGLADFVQETTRMQYKKEVNCMWTDPQPGKEQELEWF